MPKVSMSQIAKKLGVSKGLVSIALSNKYGVSDETRFKIYVTAIEMGYDFSKCHMTEKPVGKYTIIVFIKQIDLITDQFWPEILAGVEKKLAANNYRLKLEVWDERTTKEEILVRIAQDNADGIIVISELPSGTLNKLKNVNMPVIVIDGKEYYDGTFDNIRANNYLGGYLVAEYLVKKGHTKLAFVGDVNHSVSFLDRYHGFKDYLIRKCKNIQVFPSIKQSTFDKSEDYDTSDSEVMKMLKKEDRPTALFCVNDIVAKFVYDEMKKIGLKVPDDISIVGFDNILMTNIYDPSLTSVNVLRKELGELAVRILLNRIQKTDNAVQSVLLCVNLDEKKSVKDLNRKNGEKK